MIVSGKGDAGDMGGAFVPFEAGRELRSLGVEVGRAAARTRMARPEPWQCAAFRDVKQEGSGTDVMVTPRSSVVDLACALHRPTSTRQTVEPLEDPPTISRCFA